MSTFDKAVADTIGIEGDESDHPDDSGGHTKYGITEEVARTNGYTGPMSELTSAIAKAIYKSQYWDTLRLDEITVISDHIAIEMFDTGVNCGTGNAAEFLQRLLNALNNKGAHYSDIKVDGSIGPMTINALRRYAKRRGDVGLRVLNNGLNCLQGAYYVRLAELREKDESFVYGWLATRITIKEIGI